MKVIITTITTLSLMAGNAFASTIPFIVEKPATKKEFVFKDNKAKTIFLCTQTRNCVITAAELQYLFENSNINEND